MAKQFLPGRIRRRSEVTCCISSLALYFSSQRRMLTELTGNKSVWAKSRLTLRAPSTRVYLRHILMHRGRGECQVLCCCLTENKDISSICPQCPSQKGLTAFSTALTCQLLNKEIKLVVIAKNSHYSIKILNTYSVEPSANLIRGEGVSLLVMLIMLLAHCSSSVSYTTINNKFEHSHCWSSTSASFGA